MSRRRRATKFMDDQLLGRRLEQIAYREGMAPSMPFLLEAANRLQARGPPRLPGFWDGLGRVLGLSG